METLPDGLIAVVKRDCPTCIVVVPELREIAAQAGPFTALSQDDPSFPEGVAVIDDRELERSYHLKIEIVPTLIRMRGGREVGRAVGWNKAEWRGLSGIKTLGENLPENRPGCGAINIEPEHEARLAIRFGDTGLHSRRVTLGPLEDDIEACYDRGWSDGLPIVPPTEERVLRMLSGTTRDPREIIGLIPPNLAECSVEKAAVNAVMAGCKPEYLPVVLAAVEAALIDKFCMHGLLCTTYFSGPMVIVNGPVRGAIGMNSGGNVLGQGNRANAAVGRALQLVIRNVGGGKPGGIDKSALGNPGKYTYCFAEDEEGSDWEPLSVERGFAPGVSTVTLFAADGMQGIVDQQSREPHSLARSFAGALRVVSHPKLVMAADAFLVVGPEHGRVFREAGWTKADLKEELHALLRFPARELLRGAGGMAEGLPPIPGREDKVLPKFRPDGLNIVRAGGGAGMFSAIIAGWGASGEMGSQPVTKEVNG